MGVFSSGGVGIDLGSANLTICLENEGIVLCEPSYVLTLRDDVDEVLAVGRDARQMLGRHAHTVVAEREVPLVAHLLGREVYRRSVAGIGNGVVGEVTEHAVEQALVAFHHQMLRQLVHERHVLGFEL